MAEARFKLDRRGVGQLLKSDGMRAVMHARAEKIAARARQIAPVGDPAYDPHPGLYRDNITASSTSEGGARKDRAAGVVTAAAPNSRFVEFQPDRTGVAHHTVMRAVIETAATA